MSEITVIDYKIGGNIFSVCNILEHLGLQYHLSSDSQSLAKAKKIIFPGVGSFSEAKKQLDSLGISALIKEKILDDIPFLGICVGMQLLFEAGEEGHEQCPGLGVLPGTVAKFPENTNLKVPHMGWNKLNALSQSKSPLLKGIEADDFFYFVHSYRALVNDELKAQTLYSCKHIDDFAAHYWNGKSLYACQFHPEKSARNGIKVLKNFAAL